MTNLERYFGFRIHCDQVLSPFTLKVVASEVKEISCLKGFDLNDFYVYVHNLSITSIAGVRGRVPLHEKVEALQVEFRVNPKQVRNQQIRFFNNSRELNGDDSGARSYSTERIVHVLYDSAYLSKKETFRTWLITYISKDLIREKFQKVKIIANATPTESFRASYLNLIEGPVSTQMDMHFRKSVQLQLPFIENAEVIDEEGWQLLLRDARALSDAMEGTSIAIVKEDRPWVERLIGTIEDRNREKLMRAAVEVSRHTAKFAKAVGANVLANLLTAG